VGEREGKTPFSLSLDGPGSWLGVCEKGACSIGKGKEKKKFFKREIGGNK